jgi:hypothetical protein
MGLATARIVADLYFREAQEFMPDFDHNLSMERAFPPETSLESPRPGGWQGRPVSRPAAVRTASCGRPDRAPTAPHAVFCVHRFSL